MPLYPSDMNRFCADALEQIRIRAPKHTIQVNRYATRGVDLDFVSVCLLFMGDRAFHQALQETKGEVPN